MAAPVAEANRGRHRGVVCIGFMGAGKTTAARSAARARRDRGRRRQRDRGAARQADRARVRRGRRGGIPGRRGGGHPGAARCAPARRVLALGGGAIGHERVSEALADHLVIWLDVGLEVAWARCQTANVRWRAMRAEFEHLHRLREPIYASWPT